jgi:membrane-associated phospholipid phosphatase
MESEGFFQNQYLFGNIILEMIPHPNGFLGNLLNILTIICHYLAGISTFVLLIPIIYFFYNRKLGIKLAIAVLSTGIINGLQKFQFSSPRPIGLSAQYYEIQNQIKELSFGFPSGHAHISILVWGLFYIQFKNIYIRILSLFFIIFTPFSRMYAGVHFLGDVLGGFIIGLISLFFLEWFFAKYPNFPNVNEWKNASGAVHSSILAIIAFTLSFLLLEQDAISTAHKHSLIQIVSASGALAGLWFGITRWRLKFSNYDLEDIKFFPTIFLLFITISLFYIGMGRVSEHFFKDSFLFRYVRYFLLNFIIIYTVPYLSLVVIGEKENPT